MEGKRYWADWVVVELLIRGERVPIRDPSYLELLIAAGEMSAVARPGDGPVHRRLGISYHKYHELKRWAKKRGIVVPTLRELMRHTYVA